MTTTRSSSALLLALLANLALSTAGCGVFGVDDAEKGPAADTALPERGETPGAEGPKAVPVGGKADESELTEAFGVFVAPNGTANADGTRAHPVASIQAGIDLGKKAGKRVYVCTGTYREALTIADSISVIGGLDCSSGSAAWRIGASRTRIESPTSPAVRAADITSPTRLDSLDIVAPDATEPSASSIGMVVTHAKALVIASSKVSAGNAANGVDGAEGTQLVTSARATGGFSTNAGSCNDVGRCEFNQGWINSAVIAQGGTNQCEGAPGHAAESGGAGGEGGLWQVIERANSYFERYRDDDHYLATLGTKGRTSAAGADAPDAANAAALGTFGPEGYTPSSGQQGSDGAPGKGGNGGDGRRPDPTLNPATNPSIRGVWRGFGGAGGGAGGCPGLAGTPGTGGGASIAAVVIESTVTFDASELASGRGGDAGKGTFGSAATAGGDAGFALSFYDNAFLIAQPGGRGGAAGVSGNGSSGPSLGVAHRGPAPTIVGDTKLTPGAGGVGVDERSRVDALGIAKTIPATPAGLSKDILAL